MDNTVKSNYKETKIRNNSKKLMLFTIIYKASLDIVYAFGVTPFYDYKGFIMNFSLIKWVISSLFILLILPFIKLQNSRTRPSSYIVLILNYIYFIPGCTYYAFTGISDIYYVYYCLFWALLIIGYELISHIKVPSVPQKGNNVFFSVFIISVAIFAIFVTTYYNGFELKLDLKDVYEIRAKVAEIDMPTIVGYLVTPSSVIIPIGILKFLQKKNYILTAVLIVTQLAIFAFGAHKFVFFILVITLLVYMFYKNKYKRWIPVGLTLLNVLVVLETYITGKASYLCAIIQNRVLLIPNLLSYEYFKYFTLNEPDYLKQSFLRHFGFTSLYNTPIPKLIGYMLFSTNTNANTGLVGDSVSNFGWIGIIIYPLLYAVFFYVFDICTNNLSDKVVITAAVIIAIQLISGTFFSILLSGGVMLICFTLLIYPRGSNELKSKPI